MGTLYRWRSDAFKNYGSGHIIVVAPSVDEAREKAKGSFDQYACERWGWLFDSDDADDLAEREEKRAEFDRDLAGDPESFTGEVIIIAGSE